jgi:hypothetical protein
MPHILKMLIGATALSMTLLTPALGQGHDALSAHFSDEIAYIANHGVTVVPTSNGGHHVILQTSFGTRNTTALRLLLGKNGSMAPETDLGPLRKITGLQVFRVPADLDISGFNEVYIWNPKNNAAVRVAALN